MNMVLEHHVTRISYLRCGLSYLSAGLCMGLAPPPLEKPMLSPVCLSLSLFFFPFLSPFFSPPSNKACFYFKKQREKERGKGRERSVIKT